MQIGRYADGRGLTYEPSSRRFAIGGIPVTIQQVFEYDAFGQIQWPNDSTRKWFLELKAWSESQSSDGRISDETSHPVAPRDPVLPPPPGAAEPTNRVPVSDDTVDKPIKPAPTPALDKPIKPAPTPALDKPAQNSAYTDTQLTAGLTKQGWFTSLPTPSKILFIIVYPISIPYGIWAMWKNRKYTTALRIAITTVAALFLLLVFFGAEGDETPTKDAESVVAAANSESIIAGHGWGDVRLGAKMDDIEALLGSPESISDYSDAVFHQYPTIGLEINYEKPGLQAQTIFFYSDSVDRPGWSSFTAGTDKGIDWNSTPEQIIAEYGTPPEDYESEDEGLHRRRIAYRTISFRFEDNRLVSIYVSGEPSELEAEVVEGYGGTNGERRSAAETDSTEQAALEAIRGTAEYRRLTAGGMSEAKALSFIEAAETALITRIGEVVGQDKTDDGDVFLVESSDSDIKVVYGVAFSGDVVSEIMDEGLHKLYQDGKRNEGYVFWEDLGGPVTVKGHTQTVIERILKSPSTAKFPGTFMKPYDGWGFQKTLETVTVSGYVDSQNSFGAVTRSNFVVGFEIGSGDKEGTVRPLYVEFDGEVVFDRR